MLPAALAESLSWLPRVVVGTGALTCLVLSAAYLVQLLLLPILKKKQHQHHPTPDAAPLSRPVRRSRPRSAAAQRLLDSTSDAGILGVCRTADAVETDRFLSSLTPVGFVEPTRPLSDQPSFSDEPTDEVAYA